MSFSREELDNPIKLQKKLTSQSRDLFLSVTDNDFLNIKERKYSSDPDPNPERIKAISSFGNDIDDAIRQAAAKSSDKKPLLTNLLKVASLAWNDNDCMTLTTVMAAIQEYLFSDIDKLSKQDRIIYDELEKIVDMGNRFRNQKILMNEHVESKKEGVLIPFFPLLKTEMIQAQSQENSEGLVKKVVDRLHTLQGRVPKQAEAMKQAPATNQTPWQRTAHTAAPRLSSSHATLASEARDRVKTQKREEEKSKKDPSQNSEGPSNK